MSHNNRRLVAVILAGGVGTRMGTTGAQIPKVYLPIGLEPVINRPVSRCLDINEIKKIYVLTRKAHPELPNVNLEQWAETWKSLWYDKYPQVDNIYEEDLDPVDGCGAINGAIVALAQIASYLKKEDEPPSHIIVMAGDNFLDSSINQLVLASNESPDNVIIATRSIANRALARKRFGVVQVNHTGGHSNPVIDYEEKPDDPRSSDVSIGLYIFPIDQLLRTREYLAHLSKTKKLKEQKTLAGAPGYFLEWLVNKNESSSIKAVALSEGTWIDVGTPASFLTAIVQISKSLIERPQSARDLDVLGSTKDLSDKYYFLCHRAKIIRTEMSNIIAMYFQGDDAIATLNKDAAANRKVIHVEQIVNNNRNTNKDFWSTLMNANVEATFSDKNDGPRNLNSPILISGGVFLIDSAGDQAYHRGKALVPFLMRDFGAPVDAGRLTTAAGRMDKLDLVDVCVSEHAEEMIFFGSLGTSDNAGPVRILICTPPQWRAIARETILTRLVNKKSLVPMIDPKQIELEGRRDIGLTADVETVTLVPPTRHNWTVQIYYRDSERDEWQLRHEDKKLVLIPDQKSATLEFRVLWLSAITTDTGKTPLYDKEADSLGRLMGIVDGDGHLRNALVGRQV